MSGINVKLDVDKRLTELADELTEFIPKRILRGISREVLPPVERLLDRLVNDRLREQPGAVHYPFVWSDDPAANARGRRAFFARYPNGYRRTGKLRLAWAGKIDAQSNLIEISVSNPAPAAGYVYGAEQFGYQQVPGHERTGWLNAGDRIPGILLETTIELETQLEDFLLKELEAL